MTDELRPLSPQAPLLPLFPVGTKVSVAHSELYTMGYVHGARSDPLALISTQYVRGWVSGYLDERYRGLDQAR